MLSSLFFLVLVLKATQDAKRKCNNERDCTNFVVVSKLTEKRKNRGACQRN